MPHYYLDVRFPYLVVEDTVGYDFECLTDAVTAAQLLLSDSKVHLGEVADCPGWPRVEISDYEGLVATIPELSHPDQLRT